MDRKLYASPLGKDRWIYALGLGFVLLRVMISRFGAPFLPLELLFYLRVALPVLLIVFILSFQLHVKAHRASLMANALVISVIWLSGNTELLP